MERDRDHLAEIGREVGRLLEENRRFLEKVMDEEFEPEEEEGGEDIPEEL